MNYTYKDRGKAYTMEEISAGLIEVTKDSSAILVLPKKEHVYELGYIGTGSFLLDKNGNRVKFELCYADFPEPLIGRSYFLRKPKVIDGETLAGFLQKLEDLNQSSIKNAEYDFVLFFTWDFDNPEEIKDKNHKIHHGLFEDAEKLKQQGYNVLLVNLYTGNREDFDLAPEEFRKNKSEFFQHLRDTGQI